ncbi:DUF2752 domain-containing protein [Sulfidibacter corallicola]|uniref:DUF2752 domain-containing protein n=1 Tax=Sulfidibacter corallicola TaxID=2818388 RepID=A0A8A4TSP4_SULCO|nr:DUF2752 domain-containing protein [Sulfidibacter corallicola]QTD52979.1 DUF2752 domain-containing protein [Sulfidibacter corallicola]
MLRLRVQPRGRFDWPYGYLAVFLVLLAWWAVPLMLAGYPLGCPFRTITDLPCPSCGTTRLFHALRDARMGDALALNPLAFLGVVLAGVWSATDIVAYHHKRLVVLTWDEPGRRVLLVAVLTLILLNWFYLIWAGV